MSALTATARVRASLDAIACILLAPDLDDLLAVEQELGAALNAMGRVRCVDADERVAMRQELLRMRTALVRCRALGSVLDDVTQATLVSHGRGADYDRAGSRTVRAGRSGAHVKTRM